MITFENVSRAKLARLEKQLADSHEATMTLNDGDASGTITGHGVTANFDYDPTAQTLIVTVLHHPFCARLNFVEGSIQDNINKALATC